MITPIVEILKGEYQGQKAYVTYDDGEYLRVTPVDGDPLLSIELRDEDIMELTREEQQK